MGENNLLFSYSYTSIPLKALSLFLLSPFSYIVIATFIIGVTIVIVTAVTILVYQLCIHH